MANNLTTKESKRKTRPLLDRARTAVAIFLLVATAFYLGRSYGFNEACDLYEPTLKRANEVINELRTELASYRSLLPNPEQKQSDEPQHNPNSLQA